VRRLIPLLLLLIASGANAAEGGGTPPKIVDGIACAADPSITYAYYLPSHYTTEQRWPIVFVFDPRKRGAVAAEFFRDAAERYGWIIVSSNNTESDADAKPSVHAIETMLPDAQKRFSVDTKRIYLAGFSGTAIIAWAVAEVTKSVAGVIGCSGRPLPAPNYRVPFAWFGTAGDQDFNYIETMQIDRGIAAAGGVHRMENFEGPHRWAPEDLLRRGMQWMEVLAMKAGTRPRDDAFVKMAFDDDLAMARAEHEPLAAVRHYETIVRTFDGLVSVDEPRRLAAELRVTPAYARAEKEEKHAEEFELSSRISMGRVIQAFIQSMEIPMAGSLAHDLQINSLKRLASKGSYEGLAAQRVLEGIHAQTGFYAAREVTGQKLTVLKAVTAMIR
jgi:predicted esterase